MSTNINLCDSAIRKVLLTVLGIFFIIGLVLFSVTIGAYHPYLYFRYSPTVYRFMKELLEDNPNGILPCEIHNATIQTREFSDKNGAFTCRRILLDVSFEVNNETLRRLGVAIFSIRTQGGLGSTNRGTFQCDGETVILQEILSLENSVSFF